MRKLDTSAISSSIGLPVKSGTLQHIQLAYQEALGEIAKAITGSAYDPTKAYILNGCVNSGSGSNYSISAGSIFFNGEVYLVDAASFSISGSNVAVGAFATTFFAAANADPVQFTDGITRTIHQIRKIVLQPGLSGSGAADYNAWVRLNLNIPQLSLSGTGIANVSGTYPNIVINVPAPQSDILVKGSKHIGDVPSGGIAVSVNFDNPISTAAYVVLGSLFSNGTRLADSSVVWCWWDPTESGFQAEFSETVGTTQNIDFYYAVIAL
ncbi:MAG TPA: hypothetical protein VG605_08930 [Puia sp.]|nr:hypothetical protein [Puia sp.]